MACDTQPMKNQTLSQRKQQVKEIIAFTDELIRKGKVKVSPLARWSDEQVEQYVADNGVLVNPLVHDGYPSIGCWPCTRRVAPGDDPRSGRWAGTTKTKCGIHA